MGLVFAPAVVHQNLQLGGPVDRLDLDDLAVRVVFRDADVGGLQALDRFAIGPRQADENLLLLLSRQPDTAGHEGHAQ